MPETTTSKKPVKEQKTENDKYCSSCGKLIKKAAEICPKCGVRQHAQPEAVAPAQTPSRLTTKTPKDKVVAGLLALFLGGVGAHKFYLGNIGMGIVYLIFCLTFIPAIVAFFEGIIYLTFSGTQEEFTAKYGH